MYLSLLREYLTSGTLFLLVISFFFFYQVIEKIAMPMKLQAEHHELEISNLT